MLQPELHPAFRLNDKSYHCVDALLNEITDVNTKSFLLQWFDEQENVTVHTSGSTGQPKEIALLKQHMINSAFATAAYFDVSEGTRALLCLSTNYIAGKMMWVRALTLGWHLDAVPVNSHPMEGNTKTYDFVAMVPMQLTQTLAQMNQIKKLIVGGGAISPALRNELLGLETKIFETYGMTETATHIAVKHVSEGMTHFQCLPNIKIAVDQRGCLVIIAPHLSAIKLITNDLVNMRSSSTFEWLGRFDSVINSGGIKIIPEQIATKLTSLIPHRFFIAGIADERLGEKMVLIVEAAPLSGLESKIKQLKTLKSHEKPKQIYFVKHFEETKTQKVDQLKILVSLDLR